MFSASLNLEALKKATEGSARTCAEESCQQPVSQASPSETYCPEHSKPRAKKSGRSKKAGA